MKALSYLALAAYDSMNQSIAALVKELHARGNDVCVVAGDTQDAANLSAFADCSVEPVDVRHFDRRALDAVDVVIMPPVRPVGLASLIDDIRVRGLFVVSFANLFSSVVMREHADVVLAIGESKFDEFRDNGLAYPMVAVGNPQYDGLVARRHVAGAGEAGEADAASIHRVLVIDQGGYPYGEQGRRELACTLRAIAEFNPDMRFCIKPRHYEALHGRSTHGRAQAAPELYGALPANVEYLTQPACLEDIVPDFDAVVAMWSTAHLDAALAGIPLILIGGIHSLDVFDVREQRVQAAYDRLSHTGCLHDFRELQAGRVAFRYVARDYLEREVYAPDTLSCPRAIQAIEYAWEACATAPDTATATAPGQACASESAPSAEGTASSAPARPRVHIRCWREPFSMGFDQFAACAASLVAADEAPELSDLRRSYLTRLNALVQEWTYTNRCLGQPIDMSSLCAAFAERPTSEAEAACALERAEACWNASYDAYFESEEGRTAVHECAIAQDFYFDWLYERGRRAELEAYNGALLAPESLAYNRARAALDAREERVAFARAGTFLGSVSEPAEAPRRKERRALALFKPFMARAHRTHFVAFALRPCNFSRLVALAKRAFGADSAPELARHACRLLPDFMRARA